VRSLGFSEEEARGTECRYDDGVIRGSKPIPQSRRGGGTDSYRIERARKKLLSSKADRVRNASGRATYKFRSDGRGTSPVRAHHGETAETSDAAKGERGL